MLEKLLDFVPSHLWFNVALYFSLKNLCCDFFKINYMNEKVKHKKWKLPQTRAGGSSPIPVCGIFGIYVL